MCENLPAFRHVVLLLALRHHVLWLSRDGSLSVSLFVHFVASSAGLCMLIAVAQIIIFFVCGWAGADIITL